MYASLVLQNSPLAHTLISMNSNSGKKHQDPRELDDSSVLLSGHFGCSDEVFDTNTSIITVFSDDDCDETECSDDDIEVIYDSTKLNEDEVVVIYDSADMSRTLEDNCADNYMEEAESDSDSDDEDIREDMKCTNSTEETDNKLHTEEDSFFNDPDHGDYIYYDDEPEFDYERNNDDVAEWYEEQLARVEAAKQRGTLGKLSYSPVLDDPYLEIDEEGAFASAKPGFSYYDDAEFINEHHYINVAERFGEHLASGSGILGNFKHSPCDYQDPDDESD